MNQILVPLDGSALAEQALSCAVMLGRGLSAKLVLFRAVSIASDVQAVLDDHAGPHANAVATWYEAEAKEYLCGVADRLSNAGLKVGHVVQHGAAAEAIVDYAGQTDVRLIVMATQGHSGLKRWRHGSVAERVLQAAGVPVLLVRAQEADSARGLQQSVCRRILVPLDGSGMAEQVLPVVSPIARVLEAEMALFQTATTHMLGSLSSNEWYVSLQNTFEMAEQRARGYLECTAHRLNEQGLETSTAVWTGSVAESIVEYAESHSMDMIAMCTHGRTGLARWALGSVADRVLRAADVPILLVRAS